MIAFKKRFCCEQVLAYLRTIDDQWSRLSPTAQLKVNGLLLNMASVGQTAMQIMEDDLAKVEAAECICEPEFPEPALNATCPVHGEGPDEDRRASYLDELRDPGTT